MPFTISIWDGAISSRLRHFNFEKLSILSEESTFKLLSLVCKNLLWGTMCENPLSVQYINNCRRHFVRDHLSLGKPGVPINNMNIPFGWITRNLVEIQWYGFVERFGVGQWHDRFSTGLAKLFAYLTRIHNFFFVVHFPVSSFPAPLSGPPGRSGRQCPNWRWSFIKDFSLKTSAVISCSESVGEFQGKISTAKWPLASSSRSIGADSGIIIICLRTSMIARLFFRVLTLKSSGKLLGITSTFK